MSLEWNHGSIYRGALVVVVVMAFFLTGARVGTLVGTLVVGECVEPAASGVLDGANVGIILLGVLGAFVFWFAILGAGVGPLVGAREGRYVGITVGSLVGGNTSSLLVTVEFVGAAVGNFVGAAVGAVVGDFVGALVGDLEGKEVEELFGT